MVPSLPLLLALIVLMASHGRPCYRLRSKTTPTLVPGLEEVAAAEAAVAAEGGDDVCFSLPMTVKRKHIHYTHVATADPLHVQPAAFTRQSFYEHIERLYAEAYPTEAGKSHTLT